VTAQPRSCVACGGSRQNIIRAALSDAAEGLEARTLNEPVAPTITPSGLVAEIPQSSTDAARAESTANADTVKVTQFSQRTITVEKFTEFYMKFISLINQGFDKDTLAVGWTKLAMQVFNISMAELRANRASMQAAGTETIVG
jgi:hypothetical protein